MSKWTKDLTTYLLGAGYEAQNDLTSVIVDDVDKVNELFTDVRDFHIKTDSENMNWKLRMVNRSNVVYVEHQSEW
jgi:hypothetical protein